MGVLFDSQPTAQMVFRPDLHVVAANRCYCEMLGIERAELVGEARVKVVAGERVRAPHALVRADRARGCTSRRPSGLL